jgi:hypothetical protein
MTCPEIEKGLFLHIYSFFLLFFFHIDRSLKKFPKVSTSNRLVLKIYRLVLNIRMGEIKFVEHKISLSSACGSDIYYLK